MHITSHRLANHLRSLHDNALVALLTCRRDLADMQHDDFDALARYASSPASLRCALEELNTKQLRALLCLMRAVHPGDDEDIPALKERAFLWGGEEDSIYLSPGLDSSQVREPLVTAVTGKSAYRPEANAHPAEVNACDAAGAHAASELLSTVDRLLGLFSTNAYADLRAGGLSLTDRRRLSHDLRLPQGRVALFLEICFAANLLNAKNGRWLPTDFYDEWLTKDDAQRWWDLARGWLVMPRLPHLTTQPSTRSVSENYRRRYVPLGPISLTEAPALRRTVLELLQGLSPGYAFDPAHISAQMAWDKPMLYGPDQQRAIHAIIHEADICGITGRGSLATAGRYVLSNDPGTCHAVMSRAMPQPVDYVFLQADGTAIAPGPLERTIAAEMALVADAESTGAGVVYRITPASIRRALSAGRSAEQLQRFLTYHSKTPLPQPMKYMIDDEERRLSSFPTRLSPQVQRSERRLLGNEETTARVLDASTLLEYVAALRKRDIILQSLSAPTSDPDTIITVCEKVILDSGLLSLRFRDTKGAEHRRVVRPLALAGQYLRAEDERNETIYTISVSHITEVCATV